MSYSDWLTIKNKLVYLKASSDKDKPTDLMQKIREKAKEIKSIAEKNQRYMENGGSTIIMHLQDAHNVEPISEMEERKQHIKEAFDMHNRMQEFFR